MGVFSRFFRVKSPKTEQRFNIKNPADLALFRGVDGSPLVVNAETAMGVSAFWAGVNLISSSLATVPCVVMQSNEKGKGPAVDHDQYDLLKNSPGKYYTSVSYRRALFASALVYGNAYSEIIRNEQTGRPIAYELQDSSLIDLKILKDSQGDEAIWYLNNKTKKMIPYVDMIHISGLGFSGVMGLELMDKIKTTLSVALSNANFANTYYKNNAFLGGALSFPAAITEEQYQRIDDQIKNKYSGEKNRGKTLILDGGAQ